MPISINSAVLCKLVDGARFEFPQSAQLADLGTRVAWPGHPGGRTQRWRYNRTVSEKQPFEAYPIPDLREGSPVARCCLVDRARAWGRLEKPQLRSTPRRWRRAYPVRRCHQRMLKTPVKVLLTELGQSDFVNTSVSAKPLDDFLKTRRNFFLGFSTNHLSLAPIVATVTSHVI